MKAHSHGEFVCLCFFMWTHVQYEILRPSGLTVNEPQICQLIHATCHLWSLQNIFSLLNILRVGAVYTIFQVASQETIALIHVRWTLRPGPPTPKVLWKSIRQVTSTKHIMQDVQDNMRCMGARTILLGKCVHMPCFLNDRNDLILQLLFTVRYASHYALFTQLQSADVPASSGTIFHFSH
jgi:hypothetical protein